MVDTQQKKKYYYSGSMATIEERFQYLTVVPEESKLPIEAYRFNPIGQKWLDWEKEHLEAFKVYIENNNLQLPEQTKEEEILRNLQAAQFNHKKAYHNLMKSIEWRSTAFPLKLTTVIEKIIVIFSYTNPNFQASGFLYVYGRDKNFRPIINIRPRIIATMTVIIYRVYQYQPKPDPVDGIIACSFMMEYVREIFFLPGQVENWVVVIDLENMGLMNVPFKSLKQFLETFQNQYRCTSARIFLLNVSGTFQFLWSTVQAFLESHTKKKIHITKQNTCDELLRIVAPNQLQIKFGGNAPNFEGPSWPPRMPQGDYGTDPTKLIPIEDYQEFVNKNPLLVRMPEQFRPNEEKKQVSFDLGGQVEDSYISDLKINHDDISFHSRRSFGRQSMNEHEENFVITEVEFSKPHIRNKLSMEICVCRNNGEGLNLIYDLNNFNTDSNKRSINYELGSEKKQLKFDNIQEINQEDEESPNKQDNEQHFQDQILAQLDSQNSILSQEQIQIQFQSNPQEDDKAKKLNLDSSDKNIQYNNMSGQLDMSNPNSKSPNKNQQSPSKQSNSSVINVENARVVSSFVQNQDDVQTENKDKLSKDIKKNDKKQGKSNSCCNIF
ncbi:UNKNOWN [Stylonychia lemnae]|uniref:CRAL-TRIO domain-containing protein n=1 Tax=Stylonychia lemnae TaxID=5949 RepID=A0A078AGW0_STYLE|nr:UNKNOWN [Stylonychia lemnae]|eukprot:CDW81500.1 UNKNOWN [Stylonychia lemnae]